MSCRAPVYTPMCNKLLRFYFKYPEMTHFRNDLERRQHEAARTAVDTLSPTDRMIVEQLMSNPGSMDLLDSYIYRRMKASGWDESRIERYCVLLRGLQKKVAVSMGYIEA